MDGYIAVCRDCDWDRLTVTSDQAKHIGEVHEHRTGHATEIRPVGE